MWEKGSLWGIIFIVCEKEVISHSNINNLKAWNLFHKCFFFPLFICNLDDQLSKNSQRFVIVCICWDTPSELTITKGVQPLKTLDTIGNCQRLVFTLTWCISTRCMHEITNLWKFELNRSTKLQYYNERKNTLVTRSCALSDAWFRYLKI